MTYPDWLQKLITEGITIPVRLVITPEINPEFLELLMSSAGSVQAGSSLAGNPTAGNTKNEVEELIKDPVNEKADPTLKYKQPLDEVNHLTDKAYWKEIDGELQLYYFGSKVVTSWEEIDRLSKLDEHSRKIESDKITGSSSTKKSALSIFLRFYQEGKVQRPGQAGDRHIPAGDPKKYYPVKGIEELFYKEIKDDVYLSYLDSEVKTSWPDVIRLSNCKNSLLNSEIHKIFPTDSDKRFALISFVRAYQEERVRDPDAGIRSLLKVDTKPDENCGKVGAV